MYGAGGRDGYTPMGGSPSERTVFEVYLRPWLKFAQAGGRGVMLSHNMALWEPMHASHRLVTETLRNRFGLLGGYTGSDMGVCTTFVLRMHDLSMALHSFLSCVLEENGSLRIVTLAWVLTV